MLACLLSDHLRLGQMELFVLMSNTCWFSLCRRSVCDRSAALSGWELPAEFWGDLQRPQTDGRRRWRDGGHGRDGRGETNDTLCTLKWGGAQSDSCQRCPFLSFSGRTWSIATPRPNTAASTEPTCTSAWRTCGRPGRALRVRTGRSFPAVCWINEDQVVSLSVQLGNLKNYRNHLKSKSI